MTRVSLCTYVDRNRGIAMSYYKIIEYRWVPDIKDLYCVFLSSLEI